MNDVSPVWPPSSPAHRGEKMCSRTVRPPPAQPCGKSLKVVLLQLKKGGVVKAYGEGEKEKECTTECKSRRWWSQRFWC